MHKPAGSGTGPRLCPGSHTGHAHNWQSWLAGTQLGGKWRKALEDETGGEEEGEPEMGAGTSTSIKTWIYWESST
jgi:hypothetical protein